VGRPTHHQKEKRRLRTAVWTAVVTLSAIGIVFAHYWGPRQSAQGRATAGANELELTLPNGTPIPGGQLVTLDEAEKEAPFPIYRPENGLASDESIKAVWISPGDSPHIALEYANDISVFLEPTSDAAPASCYQAIVDSFDSGEVTKVGGFPALLLPGNIPGRAPAIIMEVNGTTLFIQGNTGPFSVSDIEGVAESVTQNASPSINASPEPSACPSPTPVPGPTDTSNSR